MQAVAPSVSGRADARRDEPVLSFSKGLSKRERFLMGLSYESVRVVRESILQIDAVRRYEVRWNRAGIEIL